MIFVLLEHGGVLYSGDGGETWEDRSDDRGEHWRRAEDGMPWAYTEL